MSARTYGQFCGIARALEIVGERWALLVVRDLILGPKRFTDLHEGLPKIPPSILVARLNELESAGVVQRRILGHLDAAVVYELTEYGAELERILLPLGLWGTRSLGEPTAGEVFTLDSAILSLYTTFRPDAADRVHVSYEIHYGEMVVHVLVDGGRLYVAEGPYQDADVVLEPRGAAMLKLLNGTLSPRDAISSGEILVGGPIEQLELFARLFRIPAAPATVDGLVVH